MVLASTNCPRVNCLSVPRFYAGKLRKPDGPQTLIMVCSVTIIWVYLIDVERPKNINLTVFNHDNSNLCCCCCIAPICFLNQAAEERSSLETELHTRFVYADLRSHLLFLFTCVPRASEVGRRDVGKPYWLYYFNKHRTTVVESTQYNKSHSPQSWSRINADIEGRMTLSVTTDFGEYQFYSVDVPILRWFSCN